MQAPVAPIVTPLRGAAPSVLTNIWGFHKALCFHRVLCCLVLELLTVNGIVSEALGIRIPTKSNSISSHATCCSDLAVQCYHPLPQSNVFCATVAQKWQQTYPIQHICFMLLFKSLAKTIPLEWNYLITITRTIFTPWKFCKEEHLLGRENPPRRLQCSQFCPQMASRHSEL